MAHYTQYKDGWRVQLQVNGVRKSTSHSTREEAESWAMAYEDVLRKRGRARAMCAPDAPVDMRLLSAVPTKVLKAIGELPYDRMTILSATIPCTSRSGIYFLEVGAEIVYVGQSVDVLKRISRHITDGKRFDSYAFISCPPEDMDRLEKLYITALLPDWNLSLGNR
jgi:hypothetical protein